MNRWRMALLFFISGAGTWYALGFRSGKLYLKERFKRLFVPLIFGMLVIVPPQIYIEHLSNGVEYANYWQFYPSVFEGIPYPKGSTSWHHLWFVAYLFLYSVMALPLFMYLRTEKGKAFIEKIADKSGILTLYAPVIIISLGYSLLVFDYPGPQNLINDWAGFFLYFCFFVLGYWAQLHTCFWELITDKRKVSLKIAFVCLLIINYFRWNGIEPNWEVEWNNLMYIVLHRLHAYAWVMAILGYGKQYLNKPANWLSYANEGIYPFYILHQTVIVIIGFYIIGDLHPDGIWAKFWFINLATFIVCMGIYEFFIRPYAFIRPFFGLKSIKKTPKLPLNGSGKIKQAQKELLTTNPTPL